jgi:hypothetical protein
MRDVPLGERWNEYHAQGWMRVTDAQPTLTGRISV